MWNPFKRRGPEQPAEPGTPTPAAPATPAPKRGRLGRLFGRKPKQAPPPQPPAKKAPPAKAPASGGGGGGGGAEGGGGEGGQEREYPGTLPVEATGTWKISSSLWHGTAKGTLTGAAVKVFIDCMEAGQTEPALYLIAQAYDDGSGFADNLDTSGTSVEISY